MGPLKSGLFDEHIINPTSYQYYLNTKDVLLIVVKQVISRIQLHPRQRVNQRKPGSLLALERFKQVLQTFITRCRLCPSRSDSSSIKTWKNSTTYEWNTFTTLFISQELIHYVCIPLCLYIDVITKTKNSEGKSF